MILRKIAVLFLMLVFLAFSGGIHIGKHFCKGELVDLAINTKVNTCSKSIYFDFPEKGLAFSQLSCCNTEIDFYQSDHSQKEQIDFPSIISQDDFQLFELNDWVCSGSDIDFKIPPLLSYHAPPLYILHECYLI